MNYAHVHIVLNHVPSIGTVVGVAFFIASLVQKNERLQKVSLEILALMALALLPTYVSGNAAQQIIRSRSDVPQALIEVHQNSAIITLFLMIITGTLAWFGLWQFRRFSRPSSGNSIAVLIFSVLTAFFILRTANMGGEISHGEIRSADVALAENVGWRLPIERFTNDHSWVWPASETLHFIGMPLLFGVALLLTLRMLGMMKSISYAALHRLLPLGILGFVLNAVSGMWFFIASPGMYVTNNGFVIKIIFVVLAGICILYFTLFEDPWSVGPEKDAPLNAKVIAVCAITFLLGVMFFGRMLPFIRH